MRILLEKLTDRIVLFSPAVGFAAPDSISFVTFEGQRNLTPGDWRACDWEGETPPGFNAQTSYLFKLTPAGDIVELQPPGSGGLVVI
jgi:hypothetical protein